VAPGTGARDDTGEESSAAEGESGRIDGIEQTEQQTTEVEGVDAR